MRRPHKIEDIFLLDLTLLSNVKKCGLLRKLYSTHEQTCTYTVMCILVRIKSFSRFWRNLPRTNPWNFREKYWEMAELENDILFLFLFFCFLVIGIFKCLFPNKNQLCFHMRYHLFLHYGWFLQNLEKDFIPTLLHTTV